MYMEKIICSVCKDDAESVMIRVAPQGGIAFSIEAWLCGDCQKNLTETIWELITEKHTEV